MATKTPPKHNAAPPTAPTTPAITGAEELFFFELPGDPVWLLDAEGETELSGLRLGEFEDEGTTAVEGETAADGKGVGVTEGAED